jgi:hypothetical protein
MPRIEETIPDELVAEAEAARAWFANDRNAEFKLTGIVDPEAVSGGGATRELQLILCGQERGQDVCLRERFRVIRAGDGFDVEHLDDPAPAVGSPAPLLDPPPGTREGWLDAVLGRHEFVVLAFYRGFW